MKKFFLQVLMGVAALGCSFGAMAAEDEQPLNRLVVSLNDGSTVTFFLSEYPVATTLDNGIEIKTAETSVELGFDELKSFSMDHAQENALEGIVTPDGDVQLNGDSVLLQGFAPGTAVNVFGLDGRLASTGVTDADGTLFVSLEALPAGVYVVKAGETSFKVVRR